MMWDWIWVHTRLVASGLRIAAPQRVAAFNFVVVIVIIKRVAAQQHVIVTVGHEGQGGYHRAYMSKALHHQCASVLE
jgi:hypothetical protein